MTVSICIASLRGIPPELLQWLMEQDADVEVRFEGSDASPLSTARQFLIQRARMLGSTHVFFVDDDIMPRPDVLRLLLEAKKPVIAARYVSRKGYGEAHDDQRPCRWVGMGCTLIDLSIFSSPDEKDNKAVPPDAFAYNAQAVLRDWAIASAGEDLQFCWAVRHAGHEVAWHPMAFAGHRKLQTIWPQGFVP